MKKSIREQNLEKVIIDIFWMARRYAHGRHTYAPSMIRNAYEIIKASGIKIRKDDMIKPPGKIKGMVGGMAFRSDYLDDINE